MGNVAQTASGKINENSLLGNSARPRSSEKSVTPLHAGWKSVTPLHAGRPPGKNPSQQGPVEDDCVPSGSRTRPLWAQPCVCPADGDHCDTSRCPDTCRDARGSAMAPPGRGLRAGGSVPRKPHPTGFAARLTLGPEASQRPGPDDAGVSAEQAVGPPSPPPFLPGALLSKAVSPCRV